LAESSLVSTFEVSDAGGDFLSNDDVRGICKLTEPKDLVIPNCGLRPLALPIGALQRQDCLCAGCNKFGNGDILLVNRIELNLKHCMLKRLG